MALQYAVVIAYFAVLLGIGLLAARRVHDFRDYFVGGKRLGFWVVSFSARATGESAWLLLGLTGLGAVAGLSAFWVVFGEVLGVGIAWFFMAPRFKRDTDRLDSITVPDYLVSALGAERGASQAKRTALRALAASALTLFVTIYVSAQIDATGKAFESFLDLDYYVGALLGFGLVVTYTFGGGFVAVAWSDLFQGLLMLVGLLALPVLALSLVDGGTIDTLTAIDPALTNFWGAGGLTLWNLATVVSFVTVGLGFLGSPQVFVRFMSIRDQGEIRRGRWVAILYTVLTDSGAVLIGIAGRILLAPDAAMLATLGPGGEQVLPELVTALLPPIVGGLYIAAVLSAIMSTIDSLLVVASSAATRDLYQQILRTDRVDEPLRGLSRTVTLLLALAGLAIALIVAVVSPDRTVFWFVIFGWSGIAATFCPVTILTLFWKRMTIEGAIAAMITGFACVPLFKFAIPTIPAVGPLLAQAGEMGPSFVCSLLAGLGVSWMSQR